jgi:hypothetical protein
MDGKEKPFPCNNAGSCGVRNHVLASFLKYLQGASGAQTVFRTERQANRSYETSYKELANGADR